MTLLGVALAWAVQVETHMAPCPIGDGQVKIYQRLSVNTAGGWDSDLAAYSGSGQWRSFAVATCMDNLFSLYDEDMSRVFSASERLRLGEALSAVTARLPAEPEIWDRYEIAATAYTVLGKDHAFLAELWLTAAWTARDAAVAFLPGLEGPLPARALLDAGAQELLKPLSTEDRKKVEFNLARVAQRAGLSGERDAHVAAFEAAGPLTAQESSVLARFKHLTREVEPALQDHAITEYQAALAGSLDAAARVRASFVLADTLRRRGRLGEARLLYAQVAAAPDAPEPLGELAATLRGWSG